MALMKCVFVVLPLLASAGISPALKKCVGDKLADAKSKCGPHPTCAPECVSAISDALPKLDGSCCALATQIPVDMCKQMITGATKVMASVVEHCQAEAPQRLLEGISPALKKCVGDKLGDAMSKCGRSPTCKPECVSAISDALPKLDGGCCALATKIPVDTCKQMITGASASMASFAEHCGHAQQLFSWPSDFEENSGSTASSEIPSSLLTGMVSVLLVGASAVSLVMVWRRRQRSNLPAHEALNGDGDDDHDDLDALVADDSDSAVA